MMRSGIGTVSSCWPVSILDSSLIMPMSCAMSLGGAVPFIIIIIINNTSSSAAAGEWQWRSRTQPLKPTVMEPPSARRRKTSSTKMLTTTTRRRRHSRRRYSPSSTGRAAFSGIRRPNSFSDEHGSVGVGRRYVSAFFSVAFFSQRLLRLDCNSTAELLLHLDLECVERSRNY